ncbi:hypothetical protein KR009_006367, partial [Drosophila setifemur]
NLKKSWHPHTMKNQERVWKAEEQAKMEERKLQDLRKEITEERDREELRRLGENSGVLSSSGGAAGEAKLEWMYKNNKELINREEYLLGRKIDKSFEKLQEEERRTEQNNTLGVKQPINHVEHDCVPFSIRHYRNLQSTEQVDIQRKTLEDPLMLIKQREMESRRKLLENPVKLKEIHRILKTEQDMKASKEKSKSKKSKKSKKKKKKNRKSSDGESSGSSDSDSDEDLDRKLARQVSKLKGDGDNGDLKLDKLLDAKYRSISKHLDLAAKKKKSKKSKKRSSKSSDEDEKPKRQRSREMEGKKRGRDDSTRQRNMSPEHRNQRNQRNNRNPEGGNGTSRRQRSRSPEQRRDRQRSRSPQQRRDRQRSRSPEKKGDKRRSRSPEKKRDKRRSRSPDEKREKRRSRSPEKRSEKRRSRSPDAKKDSSRQRERDAEERSKPNRDERQPQRRETDAPAKRPSPPARKAAKPKLSEADREARLREMMDNASWREADRSQAVRKHREAYAKEEAQNQNRGFDKEFINKEVRKAIDNQTSIADRIRANLNNIQRTASSMDTNFARK